MGGGSESIERVLRSYPHAGLTVEPTPIHELARLSAELGHRIYALREDLTGFGLGGNKVRKLDYLIGDALAKGADALVTVKASSFSRNAAAAARARGLEFHVVIDGTPADHNALSRSFFERFGATIHYVPDPGEGGVASERERVVNDLRDRGRSVYELHPGGSDEIGALGYVRVFDQIVRYTGATGVHFHRIMLATGSTGTQVGLLLGQCLSGYDTCVIGIAVSQPAEVQRERVRLLAESTARMLGVTFDESVLHVDDHYLGEGYAIPSEEGTRAIRMFGDLEGLLLDEVYCGKAAAGLIDYARSGSLGTDENTLFVHTGGNAGLYY